MTETLKANGQQNEEAFKQRASLPSSAHPTGAHVSRHTDNKHLRGLFCQVVEQCTRQKRCKVDAKQKLQPEVESSNTAQLHFARTCERK